MHLNEFYDFDLPKDELLELIRNSQDHGGKVRICIDAKYLVQNENQKKRPLQVNDDEIILYDELVSLSAKRYDFLRSFRDNDRVAESVIAMNIYHDQFANHDKIKRLADLVEKDLGEKVLFEYGHGHWTIIFNQQ